MKYVYITYINQVKGSRHWYMDRVYLKKLDAEQRTKNICKKFPKGAYLIDKWRLYE